jgi:hypothetical protein
MINMDDAEIKAEIDGIMKGVKDIMKKIESVTPKEEPGPDKVEDQAENHDPSDPSPERKE